MRNVALIILDTVRKDIFDQESTVLKSMADIDVDCYSASSWTVPSHASIFTGDVPSEHGVHSYSPYFDQIQRKTFMNNIPHKKIGLSTNGWLSSDFLFDELFDDFLHFHGSHELIPGGVDITRKYDGTGSPLRYFSFLYEAREEMLESIVNGTWVKFNDLTRGTRLPKLGDYGARRLRKEALKMINDGPYFLFMNFIDAHGPHENLLRYSQNSVPNDWSSSRKSVLELNETPDKKYFTAYENLYRSSVSYLDEEVGSLVNELIEHDTTVIITSDHGEGLGHPDPVFGHKGLSQCVVNVPFLIINPPEERDVELYSHLDLPSLIMGLVDGKVEMKEFEEVAFERIGDPDSNDTKWNKTLRGKYDGEMCHIWDDENDDDLFGRPISEIEKEEDYSVGSISQLEDLGYL